MQATGSKKRTDLGQWKLAALVIGIAGSFVAGAMTVTLVRDDTTPVSSADTQTSTRIDPAFAAWLEHEMLLSELNSSGNGSEPLPAQRQLTSDEAWALEQEMLQDHVYDPWNDEGIGGPNSTNPATSELPEKAVDARLKLERPKAEDALTDR
jgi:hypothetical protein